MLDPDEWATYRQLGKAYYMQKDYAKAETALQQAVRHDPQGLAHYQLGLVYRSTGPERGGQRTVRNLPQTQARSAWLTMKRK